MFFKSDYIRIAVLEADDYPSAEKIRGGYMDKIHSLDPLKYEVTVLNAFGNKNQLHQNACQAVEDRYDLIFSVGSQASVMVKNANDRLNRNIPIVFADVKDPVHSNLVEAYCSSGKNVTGVVAFNHDYHMHFDHLIKILPHTKKVLLVYNPLHDSALLQQDLEKIRIHLNFNKIALELIEVYSKRDIYQAVRNQLSISLADVVITLRQSTVLAGMSELSRATREARIPIYTSNLESVGEGAAAIGCGFPDYRIGQEGAKLSHLIAIKEYDPKLMALTLLHEKYRIRVDKKALNDCGIQLTPNALLWLAQNGEEV